MRPMPAIHGQALPMAGIGKETLANMPYSSWKMVSPESPVPNLQIPSGPMLPLSLAW